MDDEFNAAIAMADIFLSPPPVIEDYDLELEPINLRGAALRAYKRAAVADRIIDEDLFVGIMLGNIKSLSCSYCGAFYFQEEVIARTHDCSLCCQRGKIALPPLGNCPQELLQLLTENSPDGRHYRENIRFYNASLAFASTVGNYQYMGTGPQVIKVNGIVHHVMPQITPRPDVPAKFGQLYYLDEDACRSVRQGHSLNCKAPILNNLDTMLRRCNPFPAQFRQLHTIFEEQCALARRNNLPIPEVILSIAPNINNIIAQAGLDPNIYNVPTCNEIAAIFVGDEPPFPVDIRLYPTHGEPQTIRDISPLIDPLSYPLLFPNGDLGWTINMAQTGRNATAVRNTVSIREHAAYRLAIRNAFSILHYSRKLFQQWIVDTWCRIEGLNLRYVKDHQKKMHIDSYKNLLEFIRRRANDRNERVGKIFVLPSTVVGSPRYMQQKYLDAMCIVKKYGKPDLFVTFTCNPTWSDIVNNLEPGQEYMHRPDLVCRVFNIKLKELINMILKQNYFGMVSSLLYVVEFQKRGLPHAHILIILDRRDKITTAEQVDSFIRAELPDEGREPVLHELVKKHLIHKKCGAGQPGVSCVRDGRCRWKYPKEFKEATELRGDATYARYRRRDNGRVCILGGISYDNRDVVPYSPALLLLFKTHINVEICASIKSTKYLYKYIHKGHDGIVVNLQEGVRSNHGNFNWDEVQNYQECRYVSSHEACWRILGFDLSYSNISVFHLSVHLPSEENVYFDPDHIDDAVENVKDTHLQAWFDLNRQDVNARQYIFSDIVSHYTWQRNTHRWTPRKSFFNVIGRLPDISPRCGELFYLRLLLNYVRGATSYEDIRTVNGQLHDSFFEACIARHIIRHDQEYRRCLEEARLTLIRTEFRNLFINLLLFCNIENPLILWNEFYNEMIDDTFNNVDDAVLIALDDIDTALRKYNKNLMIYNLPVPNPNEIARIRAQIVVIDNNLLEYKRLGRDMKQNLNNEQLTAFTHVTNLVLRYKCGDKHSKKLVYIEGPAGTGKTYFYNALLNSLKGDGCKTIAVAFTGIAAILLLDGVTSHSQFGIPVPCMEDSSSYLKLDDYRVKDIEQADVIIWDEASMTSKFNLECVDRLLRDVMNNPDVPFGGKVLILGGDFRQLLPVTRGGRKQDVLNSSIKSSNLFQYFKKFQLTRNMRADPIEVDFSRNLLTIGDGNHTKVTDLSDEYLEVPRELLVNSNDLISNIFGDNVTDGMNENKAILTPTNEDANKINYKILNLINSPAQQYISSDTILDHDPSLFYLPIDVLHSLTPPGCPPHILILKVNAIVMLVRNLNIHDGLCNGTRVKVLRMNDHVLYCEVLTGPKSGNKVFIPRMDFTCEKHDSGLPYAFIRRQFPVKLAYAMTINKAQGQTLSKVGIYLSIPVFAHGQFYVALSRARRPNDIKISVIESSIQGRMNKGAGIYTKNIVYKEVL